jgi:hypothetical protein
LWYFLFLCTPHFDILDRNLGLYLNNIMLCISSVLSIARKQQEVRKREEKKLLLVPRLHHSSTNRRKILLLQKKPKNQIGLFWIPIAASATTTMG